LFVKHTFTIELSADLHIWGPEFSGTARISWFIISFTINFGENGSKTKPPLSWNEFKDSFLPENKTQSNSENSNNSAEKSDPLKANISAGLRQETENENANEKSITVFPDELILRTQTVVPLTSVELYGKDGKFQKIYSLPETDSIKVAPVDTCPLLKSSLTVKLTNLADNTGVDCVYTLVSEKLPRSMWISNNDNAENELTAPLVTGLALSIKTTTKEYFPKGKDAYIELNQISGYEKVERDFAFKSYQGFIITSDENSITKFSKTVMSDTTVAKRNKLIEEFSKAGFNFDFQPNLSEFAQTAEDIFNEAPNIITV
jgi:hypothetical protein